MKRSELLASLSSTFAQCLNTCREKNTDYAHADDAWGNLALVEHLFPDRISKLQGVIVRLADKLQRMAGATHHGLLVTEESFVDTCHDMIVYAGIAKAMWQEHAEPVRSEVPPYKAIRSSRNTVKPGEGPLRIYVSGPFTGDGSGKAKALNVGFAAAISEQLAKMGHYPHCPHTHTQHLDGFMGGGDKEQEYFMRLDLQYIALMMDAVFRIPGHSPGADKEVKLALALGLPVFHALANVPPSVPPESSECIDPSP